jgi:hypothetical protein
VYAAGDCVLNASADTSDCDGAHWGLDFYTKLHDGNAAFYQCSTTTRMYTCMSNITTTLLATKTYLWLSIPRMYVDVERVVNRPSDTGGNDMSE